MGSSVCAHLIVKGKRHPQPRIFREAKLGWHHPNDLASHSVDLAGLSNNARVRTEPPLPQAMAQDHYAAVARQIFFCGKRASKYRRESPSIEELSRHPVAIDIFRLPFPAQAG